MRVSSVHHRKQFAIGAVLGLIVVFVKYLIFLPVNIADILYGAALLVTLVITVGDILESKHFLLEAKFLDFIVGFMFPLDSYAVLVLFGVPLTN